MTQTLLVADDSKTIRKIVEMALKASNFNIVSVDSAQAALNAAANQPSVILLDYYMPDGSGYDVCRKLKESASTRGIPVVMLGGSYKQFDESLAKKSGADGILIKPFKTDALLEILKKAAQGELRSAPPAASAPPTPSIQAAAPAMASNAPLPPERPSPAVATLPTATPKPPIPKPEPVVKPQSAMPPPKPAFTLDSTPDRSTTPARPAPPEREPHTQPVEPEAIEAVSSTSQPRIPVAPASPSQDSTRSGSGLSSVAMTRNEIESLVKDEVKSTVKAELPGLLRTILGEVFQQKVLPKLMAKADERVASAIDHNLTSIIQQQVRAELEALLAEED